ncbi:MAG: VOC family protein [Dehalococcoidia bacterium]
MEDHVAKPVQAIPEGYRTLTPYLSIKGAAKAIAFYTRAFGAQERVRMEGPGGTIGHAELAIGDSMIMLSDEMPGMGNRSPQSLNGTTVGFALYVEDVDAAFARAVAAGATVLQPLENQFYGDRSGTVADPFGHSWSLMTHIEDVSPEEMKKRMDAASAQMAATA